ncbi:small subunit ribosomal protein S18b, mitochondrial [Paragonimus westermani]|uniref:Small ribosomal subunit protein mS40 n=1 Tax=Paragonimus westermani TaxID=34504 RepID=A0A5J4NTR9_9TREM|nr:small subunit ribosomal protein S18b, mitochondrial [Paragonimus westermani]
MSGSVVVKRAFLRILGTPAVSPLFHALSGASWSRPTPEFARGFTSLARACQQLVLQPSLPVRFYVSSIKSSVIADEDGVNSTEPKPPNKETNLEKVTLRKNYHGKPYNPVDLATSLDYVNSEVYESTYRGKPVWFYYRRNFKGHFAPPKTRPNCVMSKLLISSNPCPICRDEFLVLDYRNTKLLKQFINPISAKILEPSQTGLCQHQHKKLVLEIEKAQDLGTIEMWLPFHLYDYSDYYNYLPPEQLGQLIQASGCASNLIMDETTDGSLSSGPFSSDDIASLPVHLQDLLRTLHTIPHASDSLSEPAKVEIERPKVPNRYKMEEDYKKRVAKRRKSRTLILD